MRTADRTLLEWLGEEGVAAALRHSLDRASLVRLANARRVNIPGMRNQSVPMDQLARALAGKFAKEETSRRVLVSALDTANRGLIEEWRKLTDEESRARAADDKLTGPAAARLLYVISRERRDGIGPDQAKALFALCPVPAKKAEPPPEVQSESNKELDGMVQQLAAAEAVIERLRLREKQFQQELAQRKFDLNNLKLQLTHGRTEQERLEKEMRTLSAEVEASASRKKGAPADDFTQRVGQLQDQGKKIAAMIEKLAARSAREEKTADRVAATGKALDELRRDLGELRKFRKEESEQFAAASRETTAGLQALREEVAALRSAPKRPAPKPKVERRSGEGTGRPERVGLFVDVQNVFYGARQQNARLDFDALLSTVSQGRRMSRAAAYVVETKEIDQSGFITLLQSKGYEVKRKPLMVRSDGSFKGDWDMEIALDVLDTCENLDILVLATGDGDFTSLVQRVKARGIDVEIYSFPRNTAKSLRETATRFIPIDRRLLIKLPKDASEIAGAKAERAREAGTREAATRTAGASAAATVEAEEPAPAGRSGSGASAGPATPAGVGAGSGPARESAES